MSELLPYSEETEAVVLSAILGDLDAFWRIRPIISERSFFLLEHRRIYRAIESLAFAGASIERTAVREEIDRTESVLLESVAKYLEDVPVGLPKGTDLMDAVLVLYEYELRRSLSSIMTDTMVFLEDESRDPTTAMTALRTELDQVEQDYAFSLFRALRDRMKAASADVAHSSEPAVGK